MELTDASWMPVAALPTAGAPQPYRPTLLIADDEAGPRESLKIVFRDRYYCHIVTGGRAAIDYARQNPVDIAVLDIAMPDMKGTDVLRELKTLDPDIECIMLTGYETIETARAAVRYGAADYLSKPFDVFTMRELLDKCLARRQGKRAAAENLRALQRMNDEFTQSLAHRDRLATADAISARVIHEMNNPLAVIAGYAHMLGRDLQAIAAGEPVSEKVIEKVTSIQREIERCKEIATRFLGFVRSAAQSDPEPVDVAGIVGEATALLKAHPLSRNVVVSASIADRGVRVRARSVELIQILMNLGVNALQAMDGGGVLLVTAERAPAPPTHAYQSPTFDAAKPLVRLSVIDNGHGIAPGNLSQLFRPYFTSKPGGTGLGLSVVAELVGAYGGLIAVHSEAGKGTTFSVYLPLAPEMQCAAVT